MQPKRIDFHDIMFTAVFSREQDTVVCRVYRILSYRPPVMDSLDPSRHPTPYYLSTDLMEGEPDLDKAQCEMLATFDRFGSHWHITKPSGMQLSGVDEMQMLHILMTRCLGIAKEMLKDAVL